MKCPAYGTSYCQTPEQPCTEVVVCRNGWLQFWTQSERAGLKAMGREYDNPKHRWLEWKHNVGVVNAITAFVCAARKEKEGRP